MSRLNSLLWIWTCLGILGEGAVWAQTASFTPRQKLRSLQAELEELYSARFSLNRKGVPTITVGVMDGQRRISFVPRQRVTAIFYQADGSPRAISLRAGRRYTISRVRGNPALVRYGLVAFELRRSRWSLWKQRVQTWKKLGFPIQTVEVGSVFAIRGKMYDNRRRLGVLGYAGRAFRARLRASRIASKVGLPVQVQTFVQQRPQAMMRLSGAGKSLFSRDLLEVRSTSGVIRVDRVEFGRGYSWHKFRRRSFLGSLLVAADRSGRLALINRISLPFYLAGLLASEMPLKAPVEALKAQSVCARNEILAKIGTRHHADPYLFCAHTHCQVYTGVHRAHRKISGVLQATRGLVMVDRKGQLADASYSSVCGGHTEHNEHVWRNDPRPALRGKLDGGQVPASFQKGINDKNIQQWLTSPPDSYCRSASRYARRKFRWSKLVNAYRLNSRLNQSYPLGKLKAIRVLKRGVSGRAYIVELVGERSRLKLRGELRIRRMFFNLNSSMFVVRPVRNERGGIASWHFAGGGWGHGVGMCQNGAIGRAKAGANYRAILHHYFSNVNLVQLYR